MRVLITGGSGFVGQRLCQQLIAQGHDVQVVSRTPHDVRGKLPKACDIRDSAQAFVDTPPDALVNLAGESIAAALERRAERAAGSFTGGKYSAADCAL